MKERWYALNLIPQQPNAGQNCYLAAMQPSDKMWLMRLSRPLPAGRGETQRRGGLEIFTENVR